MKTPLRRRSRHNRNPELLDQAIAFVYEHRHKIADGLILAAVVLKNWPATIDIGPLVPGEKPCKTPSRKSRRR